MAAGRIDRLEWRGNVEIDHAGGTDLAAARRQNHGHPAFQCPHREQGAGLGAGLLLQFIQVAGDRRFELRPQLRPGRLRAAHRQRHRLEEILGHVLGFDLREFGVQPEAPEGLDDDRHSAPGIASGRECDARGPDAERMRAPAQVVV